MLPTQRMLLNSALALGLVCAATGTFAASAKDTAGANAETAARQVAEFATGEGPCGHERVQEAVALIFEQADIPAAARIAMHCDAIALDKGHAFSHTIASRIKALIAMRVRDMAALRQAGESLVAEAQLPEYVADGHMFIAFACVFGGDAKCAREHVDHAKTMFTQLQVTDALAQLQPLEQTLIQLETQTDDH